MMRFRGAAFKLGMPPDHPVFVHPRSLEHLDPHFLVDCVRSLVGGYSSQHAGQESLLVSQTSELAADFMQALFEQFRAWSTAGRKTGPDVRQGEAGLPKAADPFKTFLVPLGVIAVA